MDSLFFLTFYNYNTVEYHYVLDNQIPGEDQSTCTMFFFQVFDFAQTHLILQLMDINIFNLLTFAIPSLIVTSNIHLNYDSQIGQQLLITDLKFFYLDSSWKVPFTWIILEHFGTEIVIIIILWLAF